MASPLSPSEWKTRRSLIDPKLNALGWNVAPKDATSAAVPPGTEMLTEYPTNNGPADYALCNGGRVVGIVEAKRLPAVDDFLDRMFELSTDEVELFGTVYAAWNDLLLEARPANDAAIVAEVHGWHASKRDKFPKADVLAMLTRIREWGYVPKGTAPHTVLAPSTID